MRCRFKSCQQQKADNLSKGGMDTDDTVDADRMDDAACCFAWKTRRQAETMCSKSRDDENAHVRNRILNTFKRRRDCL